MSETFLQKCERKYDEREARRYATPRIKNWTEEYHKRQLAFFNAIPSDGTINELDHKQLFPYGPSIYRDTKKQALQIYKQFIIYNKYAGYYARVTERQEKLI